MKLRWINARNRVLGSSGFQRWAGRFPLTQPVARRRARDLFSLVAGFVYSQVMAAAVRTGLLDVLVEGPIAAADAAAKIGLPVGATERLLRAAASLDLAERFDAERFVLGSAGAALRANSGISGMILHHDLLYSDLADPITLLAREGGGGALSKFWPYAEAGEADPAAVAGYSRLMAASQPMVAEQAIDAYDFTRHRRLLDIGGGEGAFVAAVAKAAPSLECAVFDLPAVAERARANGFGAFGGSFLTDPIPKGFDLLSLVRILHDHDDEAAMHILCAARTALEPGGRLLIVEPMSETRGDARVGDSYFAFYLLAMGSGRARSPAEIRNMLKSAGFRRSRVLRTGIPIIARAIVTDG